MRRIQTIRESLSFLKGNVLVFTITQVLGNVARGMVFPYSSLYVLALGGEARQVGVVTSLTPLLGLFFFPIAGYLTDRMARPWLVALGGYFSSAVLLLYVVAPTWQVLAIAGLLLGFMVIQFPPWSSLLADSLAPQDRGKGTGVMYAIAGLLGLATPYLGGAIVDSRGPEQGIRILYAAMAIIYFINSVISQRFLKEPTPRDKARIRLADVPRVLRATYGGVPEMIGSWPPALRAMAIILILGFAANAISAAFWVVYATNKIGLSSTSWGLVLLVEAITMNVMYLVTGPLVDRMGRARFVILALLLSLVAIPSFLLVTSFWGALAVRSTVAVANAFFAPSCSALLADMVPRQERGSVMAAIGRGQIFLSTSSGGTGGPGMGFLITIPVVLSSLAGGYLYGANPAWPWYTTVTLLGICTLLAWRYLVDPSEAHV